MWQFTLDNLRDGNPVFVAHVAHNTKHSPGTTGARLAVGPNGTTAGTIGGGIMEAEVLQRAEEALSDDDFTPEYERLYHRRNAPDAGEPAKPSGLACAGNQTNVYHVVEPDEDLEIVEAIVEQLANDQAGLVEISEAGMKLTDHAPEEIEPPYRFDRGDDWRFRWQLLNWKRVAIIGGGHCGLALSRVTAQLGYTVTVFENRPDVFTFAENDYATHKIVVDDYAEAGDQIRHPVFTHVVVMTSNQPDDVRGLLSVAEGPYPYIGVMGAPAKLARIRSDLLDLGISSEAIDRFYAPIGLEMTSNTPEEIATSIAAELLRERESLFPFTRPDDL